MRILITGGSGFIGLHLVNFLLENNVKVLNLDVIPPKLSKQDSVWRNCDILDITKLVEMFNTFKPSHVVHLAAKATMDGRTLDDYKENIEGSANILEVIRRTQSVKRVIMVSSQHVRKPGSGYSDDDLSFDPLMLYGQSKVIMEIITRLANLPCVWTIVRPTTVYGPYHPYLPSGLWKLMIEGKYFHPRNDRVIRNYGYVENVVWQIYKILEVDKELINEKVLYLGDENIYQIDWVNAFSRALTGKQVRVIPDRVIKYLSLLGDILKIFGISFPMYGSRYRNLTTSNPIPIECTHQILGIPPYTIDDGVSKTVDWFIKIK